MATNWHSQINMLVPPTDPTHIVRLQDLMAYINRVFKMPVRVVSDANIAGTYDSGAMTYTVTATGPLSIDGVAVAAGDRVLLTGQTTMTQNGIYVVTTPGSTGVSPILTRADDFNSSDDVYGGIHVRVNEGTAHADSEWVLTTDDPITLDTTALTFEKTVNVASDVTHKVGVITGDGSTTTFNIPSSTIGNPLNATVQITDQNGATVFTDVTRTSTNVVITFGVAPAIGNNFRVMVTTTPA